MIYTLPDGTTINTESASRSWDERLDERGASVQTGDAQAHQRLYRSRRGRYYVERWNDRPGARPAHVEWVSEHEAIRWLRRNDTPLPPDLAPLADQVE